MSYIEEIESEYEAIIEEMKNNNWTASLGDTLEKIKELSAKRDVNYSKTKARDCLMVLAAKGKIKIEKQPPKYKRVEMN